MISSRMILALCGIFLFVAVRAEAQPPRMAVAVAFLDGQGLLAECRSTQPIAVQDCLGFATGVADAASVIMQAKGDIGRTTTGAVLSVCRPVQATNGQVRDAIVQYIGAHPADQNQSAAGLAVVALATAWPCQTQGR